MKKSALCFTLCFVIVFLTTSAIVYKERQGQFGVVSTVATSDTVSVLRGAVNDLIKLATSFSTTTTNTYTGVQTFSAGFVNNATSTGSKGFAITGGCFSLNGACLPTSGASTTLLADANTWSNSGTTTYNGNVKVSGNLQVTGNFFAPVQIVSSGNATINGLLTATSASTTNLSVNGTNIVGTSTQTSTIASTGAFGLAFATSTTWTGTSSATVMAADYVTLPYDLLMTNAVCSDDTGTLNANPTVGVTSLQPQIIGISSVPATTTFSSNNALKKGSTFKVVYGTPASSPTSASCTFFYVRQGI